MFLFQQAYQKKAVDPKQVDAFLQPELELYSRSLSICKLAVNGYGTKNQQIIDQYCTSATNFNSDSIKVQDSFATRVASITDDEFLKAVWARRNELIDKSNGAIFEANCIKDKYFKLEGTYFSKEYSYSVNTGVSDNTDFVYALNKSSLPDYIKLALSGEIEGAILLYSSKSAGRDDAFKQLILYGISNPDDPKVKTEILAKFCSEYAEEIASWYRSDPDFKTKWDNFASKRADFFEKFYDLADSKGIETDKLKQPNLDTSPYPVRDNTRVVQYSDLNPAPTFPSIPAQILTALDMITDGIALLPAYISGKKSQMDEDFKKYEIQAKIDAYCAYSGLPHAIVDKTVKYMLACGYASSDPTAGINNVLNFLTPLGTWNDYSQTRNEAFKNKDPSLAVDAISKKGVFKLDAITYAVMLPFGPEVSLAKGLIGGTLRKAAFEYSLRSLYKIESEAVIRAGLNFTEEQIWRSVYYQFGVMGERGVFDFGAKKLVTGSISKSINDYLETYALKRLGTPIILESGKFAAETGKYIVSIQSSAMELFNAGDNQLKTFILASKYPEKSVSEILLLRKTANLTYGDYLDFIAMDAAKREEIALKVITSINKPGEYATKYNEIFGTDINPEKIQNSVPRSDWFVQKSSPVFGTSESYDELGKKYMALGADDYHYLHTKYPGGYSDDYVIQYGVAKTNIWGPKVHIMLPSFNAAEHFQIADWVFDQLMQIRGVVGDGMGFKFMMYPESYRMAGSQFGKDFTIYFADLDSYLKAKPYLENISNVLTGKESNIEAVYKGALNQGIIQEYGSNMGNELYIAPYTTMAVRVHRGGTMLLSQSDALKLLASKNLDASLLTGINVSDGFYQISDNYLRLYSTPELNQFLFDAYSQGYLKRP